MKERTRFVALGDSFTEGVGDIDLRLPNNCRGWADRVAEELARHDDRTQYANLAIRGRRLQRIIDEQIEPALAMSPTLVSFYAGGNDLLMARLNMAQLMRDYEHAVSRLKASGATLLLFTGYNVPLSPLLEPLKVRTAIYNRSIRRIAAKYQTLLVDYWCFEKFQDPRMWAPDRLHMASPATVIWPKRSLRSWGRRTRSSRQRSPLPVRGPWLRTSSTTSPGLSATSDRGSRVGSGASQAATIWVRVGRN